MSLHNIILSDNMLGVNLAKNAHPRIGESHRDFAVEFMPVHAHKKLTLVIRRHTDHHILDQETHCDRPPIHYNKVVCAERHLVAPGPQVLNVVTEPTIILMRHDINNKGFFTIAPWAIQRLFALPDGVCECFTSCLPQTTHEDAARMNKYHRLWQQEVDIIMCVKVKKAQSIKRCIRQAKEDANTDLKNCIHLKSPSLGENLELISTCLQVEKDLGALSDLLSELSRLLRAPSNCPKPCQATTKALDMPIVEPKASSSSQTLLPEQEHFAHMRSTRPPIGSTPDKPTPPGCTHKWMPWGTMLVHHSDHEDGANKPMDMVPETNSEYSSYNDHDANCCGASSSSRDSSPHVSLLLHPLSRKLLGLFIAAPGSGTLSSSVGSFVPRQPLESAKYSSAYNHNHSMSQATDGSISLGFMGSEGYMVSQLHQLQDEMLGLQADVPQLLKKRDAVLAEAKGLWYTHPGLYSAYDLVILLIREYYESLLKTITSKLSCDNWALGNSGSANKVNMGIFYKVHLSKFKAMHCMRWWDKASWTIWDKSSKKQLEADRGSLPYLKKLNCKPLMNQEVKCLRKQVRHFWEGLAEDKKFSVKWAQTSLSAPYLTMQFLRENYEVFRLCNYDWKAKHFCTTKFPEFWQQHLNDKGNKKQKESPDGQENTVESVKHLKLLQEEPHLCQPGLTEEEKEDLYTMPDSASGTKEQCQHVAAVDAVPRDELFSRPASISHQPLAHMLYAPAPAIHSSPPAYPTLLAPTSSLASQMYAAPTVPLAVPQVVTPSQVLPPPSPYLPSDPASRHYSVTAFQLHADKTSQPQLFGPSGTTGLAPCKMLHPMPIVPSTTPAPSHVAWATPTLPTHPKVPLATHADVRPMASASAGITQKKGFHPGTRMNGRSLAGWWWTVRQDQTKVNRDNFALWYKKVLTAVQQQLQDMLPLKTFREHTWGTLHRPP
ncbi:hypothetical protein CONPUDRAFT_76351 [Coniophora puteana RWD-64-598 SS2]|uniref:Uncharacterized protein n=1 Tax=Coniophora puteana (strain RWD-64-598) TaxID=741705 RepID=A0A5M3MC08_CONPW|nr:uncharacterized protein CONPUDRAFT_76351 [Coniophora puteana RWD-64-598 SS2]EIW76762.1 hypothetical protein CONPUDRAFT_76351 [Coniophora puteana RWD-64-598 SS2]